jgi:aryl-alcohol dehydrogenase-like predicted oxidoreductase
MKSFVIERGTERLILPKISLGTTMAWHYEDREKCFQIMDDYVKAGGNCIDTARVYGESERVVGEWLKKQDRNSMILSTKGGHPPIENLHTSRLDRNSILSDFEKSIELLQTGYIDIYFLHRDDPSLPVSEIMPVLHKLVKERKVRFLGASNWMSKRIEEANQFAENHGLTPFSISQIQYSLSDATPEMITDDTLVYMTDEEYKWYQNHQFPVMAFSSQARGFFSKYLLNPDDSKIDQRMKTPENLRRAELVRKLSQKYGQTAASIVLSYLTSDSLPVSAVVGFSSLDQLQDSLSGQDFSLNQKEWKSLNGEF